MATQQPLLMRDDGSSGGGGPPICIVDPGYGGVCVWYPNNGNSGPGATFTSPTAHQIRIQVAQATSATSFGAYLPIVSAGKCYVEFTLVGVGYGPTGNYKFGLVSAASVASGDVNTTANPSFWINNIAAANGGVPGYAVNGGSDTSYVSLAPVQNDVIGIAIDHSTGNIWARKNGGAWVTGDPVAGTSPLVTMNSGAVYVAIYSYKGTSYSADFNLNVALQGDTFAYTIPTGYSPYVPLKTAGTVLLQHFDTNFNDTSPIAATITVAGTPTISSAQSVFGGNSYHGAAGAYTQTPNSNNVYNTRTMCFSVTIYMYRQSNPPSYEYLFITYGSPGSGSNIGAYFAGGTPDLTILFYGGTFKTLTGFLTGSYSTWIRLDLIRYYDILYIYKNGTCIATGPAYFYGLPNAYVATGNNGSGPGYSFLGYLDEFCYTTGVARYVPALVQAAPSLANDANWANNVLMLHFDGAQGSTAFTDSSPNASSVSVTVAGPILDAQMSRFGTACYYNPGVSGGYITATLGAAGIMAGDFTVDFWLYSQSNTCVFYCNDGTFLNNSKLSKYTGSITDIVNCYSTGVSSWTHVAIVRASGVLSTYTNFVLNSSVSYVATIDMSTIKIGIYVPNGTFSLYGYLDEFRVTAGVARLFTPTFTPPILPYCNGSSAPGGNTGNAKLVGTPLTITAGAINNPNPNTPIFGQPMRARTGYVAQSNSIATLPLFGSYMGIRTGTTQNAVFDAVFGYTTQTINGIFDPNGGVRAQGYVMTIRFSSTGTLVVSDSYSVTWYNSTWVTPTVNFPQGTIDGAYKIRVTIISGASFVSYTAQANLSVDNVFTISGFPTAYGSSCAVQFNLVPLTASSSSPTPTYPNGQFYFAVNS